MANNTSSTLPSLDHKTKMLILILQVSEASAITCANIAVITIYVAMRNLRRKIPNYLLFSQSLSDIFIALMMWFELMLDYYNEDEDVNDSLLVVRTAIIEYSIPLSLGTLLLCAVERYLSITQPYYHKRKVTLCRMIIGTAFVWIAPLFPCGILLSLMNFRIDNFNCISVITYSYVFDAVMLGIIILVLTILLLTLKVARASYGKQMRASRLLSCTRNRSLHRLNAYRKRLRLVTIFIIMIVTYTFTFLPLTIGRVLFDTGVLNPFTFNEKMIIITVCHALYKFSALFNPFLTMFLKEDYRTALRNIFRGNLKRGFMRKEMFLLSKTQTTMCSSRNSK